MLKRQLRQLSSPHKTEQASARKALLEAGKAAVPLLLEALRGEDQLTRIHAAAILGEIDDERTEATLIGLLQDADPRLRHTAIHTLGRRHSVTGGQALVRVVQADPDLSCRKTALYWLAQTPDQTLFESVFISALEDASLAGEAAWNISRARRGSPQIVDRLLQALPGSAELAFPMLIHALGVLGDRRAFEPIAAYLASADSYRRGLAAQALGNLGDTRAAPLLSALLEDQALAWTEDHGPDRTVADIARQALESL